MSKVQIEGFSISGATLGIPGVYARAPASSPFFVVATYGVWPWRARRRFLGTPCSPKIMARNRDGLGMVWAWFGLDLGIVSAPAQTICCPQGLPS